MVCGVGINDMPCGWSTACKWNYLVYMKWSSMVNRCYSEKYQKRQPTYKGCYVCDKWLILSNFVEDFPKIDGYDEKRFLNNELSLDKDIKSDNKNKCYCLEQCVLVSKSENSKQMIKHYNYMDEERLKKISKNNKGKRLSEEAKQKISKAKKGKTQGKEHHRSKKVAQYDKEGNLIRIYDAAREAWRKTGINSGHISECCRGGRKSAGGYIWKYCD